MTGEKTPLVSIIVPVYNVESYLKRCLESILSQTLTDFEVICVNDGSTDHSLAILEKFAQKDGRIRVISQKNGGLVNARKTGAKFVSGEYVICIDSDDWIENTYLEDLVKAREGSGADIVIANLYYATDEDISVRRNACREGIYHSDELWPEMISKPPFFEFGILPNLVAKLIKSSIFCKCARGIDEKISLGEDAALSYSCLMQPAVVSVTNICGYHYVQRSNSITKTYVSNEYESCMRVITFLERLDAEHNAGLRVQIQQYRKFLMLFRCPEQLDLTCSNQVLVPYGGIPISSRIALYGAGGAGCAFYSYLTSSKKAEVILWIDRDFKQYQKNGLPVEAPVRVTELSGQYDFVVIAVISEKAAQSIRRDAVRLGVPDEKIRWLTDDFLESR